MLKNAVFVEEIIAGSSEILMTQALKVKESIFYRQRVQCCSNVFQLPLAYKQNHLDGERIEVLSEYFEFYLDVLDEEVVQTYFLLYNFTIQWLQKETNKRDTSGSNPIAPTRVFSNLVKNKRFPHFSTFLK